MFEDMPFGGTLGKSSPERVRVGVTLAKVCDIKDPDNLGRVKCEVITGDKDVAKTEWAYVATPFGGNKNGIFFHPHVGNVVLLAFEDGDIHSPFVIGSLWWKNKDIACEPPVQLTGENEKNVTYLITTPQGNSITLSDEENKELVEIKTKAGSMLSLDDGGKKIELKDVSGKTGITIDTENSAISIKCDKFELDVQGNKLTIDSSGAKLECKPSITVKSATVTIEATGTGTVKGAALNLESSGASKIKGTPVNIN